MTKLSGEIAHRSIDPKFGDKLINVREFQMLEPVPHINSDPNPDGGPTYADVAVDYTVYDFQNAGMTVKRGPDGKPFELSVQAHDQYGYQREFSIAYRRVAGTDSFRWVVSTYQHPFHRPDQDQDVSAGKAQRFMDRLIELVEQYPSLVFNNAAFTEHKPPRFRPRHEGFVKWHTALLNGAEFTVKLLD